MWKDTPSTYLQFTMLPPHQSPDTHSPLHVTLPEPCWTHKHTDTVSHTHTHTHAYTQTHTHTPSSVFMAKMRGKRGERKEGRGKERKRERERKNENWENQMNREQRHRARNKVTRHPAKSQSICLPSLWMKNRMNRMFSIIEQPNQFVNWDQKSINIITLQSNQKTEVENS